MRSSSAKASNYNHGRPSERRFAACTGMMASFDKDVECILAERMTSRRGVPAYKLFEMEGTYRTRSIMGTSGRAVAIRGSDPALHRRRLDEGRSNSLSAARESKKKLLSAPTREIRCAL
ncbi:hypothetical protein Acr_00g0004270 [Actinidia rufa]|uniref:Uncharacterized protein n=1 Tax=Actinidia rufa TaxID=165716 RepID=A0A7J0D955_9ERIC|nr:hypothetical protein Acr_00g0004130 [Actinidia rufa]GFS28839.1 hypothetical protein Acr_00g0004220 [Actinidia rufa]GFS28848.1 hypothetical protein Acr_00g0004270 [Actinidia rufa]